MPPLNEVDWTVGCLGIVEACSSECEKAVLECVAANATKIANAAQRETAIDVVMIAAEIGFEPQCRKPVCTLCSRSRGAPINIGSSLQYPTRHSVREAISHRVCDGGGGRAALHTSRSDV